VNGVRLDATVVDRALFGERQLAAWGASFAALTRSLVESKSIRHVGSTKRYVDVVKDVINLVPVYWIANEVLGLPLKTDANSHGSMREQTLYKRFADVADYVFLDTDAGAEFELRENSAKVVEEVVKRVERHLTRLRDGLFSVHGIVNTAVDTVDGLWAGRNEHSDAFLKSLLTAGAGTGVDVLANTLAMEVLSTAALYSKALALIVDLYLDDGNQEARAEMVRLASGGTEMAVLGQVRHALGNISPVGNGQPYGMMNTVFFEKTSVEVLRVIFSLPGLVRAPGSSGILNKFTQNGLGAPEQLYIDPAGKIGPWPASLVVQYN